MTPGRSRFVLARPGPAGSRNRLAARDSRGPAGFFVCVDVGSWVNMVAGIRQGGARMGAAFFLAHSHRVRTVLALREENWKSNSRTPKGLPGRGARWRRIPPGRVDRFLRVVALGSAAWAAARPVSVELCSRPALRKELRPSGVPSGRPKQVPSFSNCLLGRPREGPRLGVAGLLRFYVHLDDCSIGWCAAAGQRSRYRRACSGPALREEFGASRSPAATPRSVRVAGANDNRGVAQTVKARDWASRALTPWR